MASVNGKADAMVGQARTGTEVLDSIIALLLSLAALADRAAASRPNVRCRALVFLHQAEAVAYASLFDVARELGAPTVPHATVAPPHGGDSRADAAGLAVRLRALALILTGLLTWLRKVVHRDWRAGLETLGDALFRKSRVADLPPAIARPRVDTS